MRADEIVYVYFRSKSEEGYLVRRVILAQERSEIKCP